MKYDMFLWNKLDSLVYYERPYFKRNNSATY